MKVAVRIKGGATTVWPDDVLAALELPSGDRRGAALGVGQNVVQKILSSVKLRQIRIRYNLSERTLVIAADLKEYESLAAVLLGEGRLALDSPGASAGEIPGQVIVTTLVVKHASEFAGSVHGGVCTVVDDPEATGGLLALVRGVLEECDASDIEDSDWHAHLLVDVPPRLEESDPGAVVDVMVCGPTSAYV